MERILIELYAKNSKKEWQKAQKNKVLHIRAQAFNQTGNWKEAENDKEAIMRIKAIAYTGNWEKALKDKNNNIREIAKQILELRESKDYKCL